MESYLSYAYIIDASSVGDHDNKEFQLLDSDSRIIRVQNTFACTFPLSPKLHSPF